MQADSSEFKQEFENVSNPENVASVSFGWPIQQATGEWSCSFNIIGLEVEVSETIHGVDGFQAILLSMHRIHDIFKQQDDQFLCQGAELNSVFPINLPVSYGSKFITEVENLIANKINEEEKRLYDKYSKKYPNYPKNFGNK